VDNSIFCSLDNDEMSPIFLGAFITDLETLPAWTTRYRAQKNALITGASRKGTRIRLFHPPAAGRVMRGFEGLHVGDRVHVQLVGTDGECGFINFPSRGREGGLRFACPAMKIGHDKNRNLLF
jgi:hypothetical protein